MSRMSSVQSSPSGNHPFLSTRRVFFSGRHWALFLLALVPFLQTPLGAQTRERGPVILELPASTRALALGDAFALGSRDSDVVFYHPGALHLGQGFAASVQRYGDDASLVGISAGTDWFGGSVVVGARFLSYGAGEGGITDASEILDLPDDPGSVGREGWVGASESVLSLGYGREVMGLRMGVVGKALEQRFGNLNAATAAVDLGVSASPGPLALGLSVQNLGPALEYGEGDVPLPVRYTLGATSEQAQVGPLDLTLSTALTYRVQGDLIAGGGMEVSYWPVTGRTFVGRVGYRQLPDHWTGSALTFGAAFQGDDIVLEYAYEGFDGDDPAHRITVAWR